MTNLGLGFYAASERADRQTHEPIVRRVRPAVLLAMVFATCIPLAACGSGSATHGSQLSTPSTSPAGTPTDTQDSLGGTPSDTPAITPLVADWQSNGKLVADLIYPDNGGVVQRGVGGEVDSVNLYTLDGTDNPPPLTPSDDGATTVKWHSAFLTPPTPAARNGLVVVLAEMATPESGLTPASDTLHLLTYDPSDGSLQSNVRIKPPTPYEGDTSSDFLIYGDERVAVYERDSQLTAFSTRTGKKLWSSEAANAEAASVSAAGRVFTYDNSQNRLEAIDPASGKRLYFIDDAALNNASNFPPVITPLPGDNGIVGNDTAGYTVRNLRTGESAHGLPSHAPTFLYDGRSDLLVSQVGNRISVFSASTLTLIHTLIPKVSVSLRGASDGQLYVAASQNLLLDAKTGHLDSGSWTAYPVLAEDGFCVVDAGPAQSNPNGYDIDELVVTNQALSDVQLPQPEQYPTQ
jgi:hypothetical protein